MDNGLEMNGWRDDGVLEGLRMKWMACDGRLGEGAMDGTAIERSKAWWWSTGGQLVHGRLNVRAIDGY